VIPLVAGIYSLEVLYHEVVGRQKLNVYMKLPTDYERNNISRFYMFRGTSSPSLLKNMVTTMPTSAGNQSWYPLDEDSSNYFWTNGVPQVGDTYTVELASPSSGLLLEVETGKVSGEERLSNGVLETTSDGSLWTTIATFSDGRAQAVIPDQTTAFRIRVTAAEGNWLVIRDIKLSASVNISHFEEWTNANGLSNSDGGLGDDPDHDGYNNLIEFALHGNPNSSILKKYVATTLETIDGNDFLLLTCPVRTGAVFSGSPRLSATVDGIVYTIEGSSDLKDYTHEVSEVSPARSDHLPSLNSGWSYRTFKVPVPSSTAPKCFLRIHLAPEL